MKTLQTFENDRGKTVYVLDDGTYIETSITPKLGQTYFNLNGKTYVKR